MKKITLICYGKLKTPGLLAAVEEFSKRLSKYTDFKTFELKREEVIEVLSSPALKPRAGNQSELWCLDETGIALKTSEWAKYLLNINEKKSGELVLVIGGSFGLTDAILKSAHRKVSFGPQTLSHQLARLVLVEQLYRALSVNAGHPYHKEG